MAKTTGARGACPSREETREPRAERDEGLTVEQEWERFDAASRRYLGMGGEAFLDRYHAGTFDDDPDRFAVMHVWLLRPSISRPMP